MLVSKFPQRTQQITDIIYLWFTNDQVHIIDKKKENSLDKYVTWEWEE